MFILTNSKNVIINISNTLEEQEDRYLINNGRVAVFKQYRTQDLDGNITIDETKVFEVVEIPEGVEEQKYCYTTQDGFYRNPDYVEEPSIEDDITDLQLAQTELAEMILSLMGGAE